MVPLVGGQAVSLFGDYIAFFSLPYFVLALTADPLDLGLTAAAETLPMLLFGLVAGVILDRWRNLRGALVVVDLPFASYEQSPAHAFATAARVMQETGAGAVKLEGGAHMAETVNFLVERGIPVLSHIGLTPQSVNALGGYKVQGRGLDADRLMADARAHADAGAFGIVVEKTTESIASAMTQAVSCPTIGIGASPRCDGQILVVDDILGMFPDFRPKFAKVYAELGEAADAAVKAYAEEVRSGAFPEMKHTFKD